MATISTPARQPFGILDDSKLRNLQSIKNRQNAITPHSAPSLKRRAPSPELSDSENIDPAAFDLSAKRKRAFLEDDVSIAKQSNKTRTKIVSTSKLYTPISLGIYTPRVETFVKPTTTPLSAPARAAGRSPTHSKPSKSILKRKFAPPSFTAPSPTLSIAAALRGTLAHGKRSLRPVSKRTSPRVASINESKPKSWDFAIFEESEEQQDYRMCEWTMTQSSAALEISDDESKTKSFNRPEVKDDRGKENVDPNEMSSSPVAPADATHQLALPEEQSEAMDTKEPRTPLGDLNASKFYGEGLNATSVVLVHDDEAETDVEAEPKSPELIAPAAEEFTFEAPREPSPHIEEDVPDWAQKTSLVFDEDLQQEASSEEPIVIAEDSSIEIWESESAKDENEQYQHEEEGQGHQIVVGEGQTISLTGPCLDEL